MATLTQFRDRLLSWYEKSARDLPWRKSKDPYFIWLSEIMCQQTGVATVIPYFERFIQKYPSIKDLAAANEEDVIRIWEGLGYYSRARNLKKAAELVVNEYGSQFPDRYDLIRSLPGVGEYTAGAILSIAFQKSTPALDGNLIRVYSRYYGIHEPVDQLKTKKKLWKIASDHSQHAKLHSRDFAEAMMELGALICRPKQASCTICPIKAGCVAFKEGLTSELPKKSKRQRRIKLAEAIYWFAKSHRILVLDKGSDPKYPHFYRLPFRSLTPKELPKRYLLKEKYSVTHRDFSVFVLNKKPRSGIARQIWMNRSQIESASFPAIDRRVIEQLWSESA